MTLYQDARILESRGHDTLAQAARVMASKMESEKTFQSSAAMRKSMQSGMRRGASSGHEDDAQSLLDRMGKKTRTKAQEDMDASFGGKDPSDAPRAPKRPKPSGPSRDRSKRW